MSEMNSPPPHRGYRSELRAKQAAETRTRILDAAAARFTAVGYMGTSLSDIATAAGVSVETVKMSGPKRRLLFDAFVHSFAGSDDIYTLAEHGPIAAITAETDNTRYLAGIARFVAEANQRSSVLWTTLVSTAMSDLLLHEELAGLQQRRRADMLILVGELRRRGLAHTSEADHTVAESVSFILSPEGYNHLVRDAGWSQPAYEAWLVRGMLAAGE